MDNYQYHIFSPYRVCPLGAHVDHQHGLVTGFAINKGVDLWFNIREDAKVQRYFETTKCLADFYQFNQKNPAGLAALRDERYVKEMYLETTDYQLFAVYTVEKWIGICLKGCGVL